MSLQTHERNENGAFRRERNDSLARNLRKDYTEFYQFRADAELGTIKEKLGLPENAPINTVRTAIRKQS